LIGERSAKSLPAAGEDRAETLAVRNIYQEVYIGDALHAGIDILGYWVFGPIYDRDVPDSDPE